MDIMTIILFLIFAALLLTTTPIAVAMGLTSLIYFVLFIDFPLTQLSENLFHGLNKFSLMAVPFFVLAANIMSQGGISKRIISMANAMVGHLKGGLGVTAVLSCMFFAAISGSSPATVVAVGTLLIPEMIKAGYDKKFASGIIATSGSLGILIPPSIAFIVYGIATEQSIGDLFLAGIIPGLLGGLMIIILVIVISRFRTVSTFAFPRTTWREKFKAFRESLLSLLLPIFIIWGIYGGIFTPTEAAGMAVFYALIVSLFVYREIKWKDLIAITIRSARTSAMILFIIVNAMLFSFVLTYERIPAELTSLITGMNLQPWAFLIVVNLLLLIVGAFMDTISALVILAPILLPVAMELGIHPIHFGVIMVMNLEIGLITPPFGVNLFVASGITKIPPLRVAQGATPSALVLLAALMLVTYIPYLALALIK